jgi:hypothetical protein
MQDLVIARGATWRPVPNLGAGSAGQAVLPPSPNRLAVCGVVSASGVPLAWRISESATGPVVNVLYDSVAASALIDSVVHIKNDPGVFNTPLYSTQAMANVAVWELVSDTPLGLAVQSEYETLVGR